MISRFPAALAGLIIASSVNGCVPLMPSELRLIRSALNAVPLTSPSKAPDALKSNPSPKSTAEIFAALPNPENAAAPSTEVTVAPAAGFRSTLYAFPLSEPSPAVTEPPAASSRCQSCVVLASTE